IPVSVGRPYASGEMITLVHGHDEERVALVDSIALESREERLEGGVVVRELLLVVRLTRAGGAGQRVVVVRVREVRVGHWDASFLHLRDIAERVLREHAIKAREAAARIASAEDRIAGRVIHAGVVVGDRLIDVLGAEERIEAVVPAWLI